MAFRQNQDDEEIVKEERTISNRLSKGVARLRETQVVNRVESDETDTLGIEKRPTLEDVDGVGPATADKLRDAGVDTPLELARITPHQIEQIEGVGPKRAGQIARKFQYGQDIRASPDESTPDDVREANADRSSTARRTDRSFNAKLTLDEDEWLENPDRLDYPGVDNIPEQRRAERGKTAARQSGVSGVETGSLPGRTQGRQAGGRIEVDTQGVDPVSTFAHEVGHAIEPQRGFAEEAIFEEDEELRDQAAKLSTRRRFTAGKEDPDFIRENLEQDEDMELFADAVGVAIEEPRAARREAPELISKIEQEFPKVLPGKRG